MQININSVHFKADKKLTAFINNKLGKLTHLYEGVIGSDVTLKLENTDAPENKIAEIRVFIRGNDLYAKKQCKTFEEATDQAIDALKRQITKYKEKIKAH
ncbi:MAG: ribosome-associated translation inhibitor RaiA [Bacteroidales bacterium]